MKPTMVTTMVAGLLLAGCATGGLAHRFPTVPLAGQAPAVAGRDAEDCERGAAPTAEASAPLVYVACMIARGYQAYVPGFGSQYDVSAPHRPPAPEVLRALVDCHNLAFDPARQPSHIRVLTHTGLVLMPVGAVATSLRTEYVDGVYLGCMRERGYVAARWQPR
jgi:hypothetical protein